MDDYYILHYSSEHGQEYIVLLDHGPTDTEKEAWKRSNYELSSVFKITGQHLYMLPTEEVLMKSR